MNKDREMREKDQGTRQDHPAGNVDSAQMGSGEKTTGGAGGGMGAGRPDTGASRSSGQGNVTQQSGRQGSGMQPRSEPIDGGAPSDQTSGAKDESGQV